MALQTDVQQTDVQQDAQRRVNEYGEEVDRNHVTNTITSRNGEISFPRLAEQLEDSAQSLRHAAENIENRGLKLLLKVLAQERAYMVNTLRRAAGKQPADALDPAHESPATHLQHGLQDIQTSMTVQRQGRENVALGHVLKGEDALLNTYARILESGYSGSLRGLLEAQYDDIHRFYGRLETIGTDAESVIARVFDTRIEGDHAVTRLREGGLHADQIDVAPMNRLVEPILDATKKPATPKNTMAAGAFSGALIGGIVGLALALFVWTAPQLVGWVTVGPWALILGALLFGAFFGTVIGFFIGQNKREDDLAVTADGVINGEVLVVAYPQPHQVAMAEDALQVHHARELNR